MKNQGLVFQDDAPKPVAYRALCRGHAFSTQAQASNQAPGATDASLQAVMLVRPVGQFGQDDSRLFHKLLLDMRTGQRTDQCMPTRSLALRLKSPPLADTAAATCLQMVCSHRKTRQPSPERLAHAHGRRQSRTASPENMRQPSLPHSHKKSE